MYILIDMCGGVSLMWLFMLGLGLAGTYAITTFGPKLSLPSKVKGIKTRMKTFTLAHDEVIS
jgi:hypothetical protein